MQLVEPASPNVSRRACHALNASRARYSPQEAVLVGSLGVRAYTWVTRALVQLVHARVDSASHVQRRSAIEKVLWSVEDVGEEGM